MIRGYDESLPRGSLCNWVFSMLENSPLSFFWVGVLHCLDTWGTRLQEEELTGLERDLEASREALVAEQARTQEAFARATASLSALEIALKREPVTSR